MKGTIFIVRQLLRRKFNYVFDFYSVWDISQAKMKVGVQPSIDLHAFSIFSFFLLFLAAEVLLQEGSVLNTVRGSWVVTLFIGVLNQKWNVFIPTFASNLCHVLSQVS